MKKSNKIGLVLIPAIAASLLTWGCDETPEQAYRTCLEPNGQEAPIEKCEQMYQNRGHVDGHSDWFYYWYYSPSHPAYYPGTSHVIVVPRAGGGSSFVAPEGSSFGAHSSVGAVSRGGFGSIGGTAAGE